MVEINGLRAIVTGASKGVGRLLSIKLIERGAKVLGVARSRELLRELEKKYNGMFYSVQCDLASTTCTCCGKIIEKAYKVLGGIDVLVNNAGITKDTYFLKMKDEQWDKVINVNLKGAFNCSKAVTPYMIRQGGGVIINISSIVGLLGNIGQANYAASKAGLIGLTYTLAKELAPYGIRVVAIAPGFARTRMALAVPPSILRDYIRRIPIPRLVEPDEIAKLAYHIAENEALNGIVIPIDLGTTIASPKS